MPSLSILINAVTVPRIRVGPSASGLSVLFVPSGAGRVLSLGRRGVLSLGLVDARLTSHRRWSELSATTALGSWCASVRRVFVGGITFTALPAVVPAS